MGTEGYRIASDPRSIVLSKVGRDEEGDIRYTEVKEESQTDIGYFQTVSSRLKAIQRDYVLNEEGTIKGTTGYKEVLENVTRQSEQTCGIKEEK